MLPGIPSVLIIAKLLTAQSLTQPPSDRYIASVLGGIPVTQVLNCTIELWRNLEIDDDELLEIVIREVSY